MNEILVKLRSLAGEDNPDDKFTEASARLFRWIVNKQEWSNLLQYPAFSRGTDANREFILLRQINQDNTDLPLAPVGVWPEELRQFAEIFPPSRVLADEFNETLSSEVWQMLSDKGIVGINLIVTDKMYFNAFLPDEPLSDDEEHETSSKVKVTDIAFLTGSRGSMERIRNSRSRARLFWRFLTEYLASYDYEGLNLKKADCDCGKTHGYFHAAWLVPLVRNSWVPLGNDRRDKVTASSLANLLRDGDGLSIPDNDAINKLLEAIRISRFDLMRESMSGDDKAVDDKAVDDKLMNIMAVARNNPESLDIVPRFLEQLQEDEGIVEYIEERRKQKQTVHQNQQLGSLVEELVRQNLENKGFKVEKTHVGADLVVERASNQTGDVSEDDVTELELSKDNRSWLVEVKATRDNDARMTPAQAKNAVKEGDRFLLCVVPVEADVEPALEDVRANMRFVEDIGDRVSFLCENLDDFEKQRSDITKNYGEGVQLVVMSGTTRVRVDKSVWEDEGFGLVDLSARLK